MESTNLDRISQPELSTLEIYNCLRYLFFTAEDLGVKRFSAIAAFIERITDENLLLPTIGYLTKQRIALRDNSDLLTQLIKSGLYSKEDLVKVDARAYALQLNFLVFQKTNEVMNGYFEKLQGINSVHLTNIPSLLIHVNGRFVHDNFDEALAFVRNKSTLLMQAEAEAMPLEKGKQHLNEGVRSLAKLELDLQSPGYFENERSYLSIIKETLTEKVVPNQNYDYSYTHPEIFINDGFALWDYLMDNTIKKGYGRLADIAYFYWRMTDESDQYIYQRPEVFKKWFQRTYGEELGQFASLSKVRTETRDRDYSIALDWHKNSKRL